MSALMPEYTLPLLDGQEDRFEKGADISAQDNDDTTAERTTASIGVATKKFVSAIILATITLVLINVICVVLVTRKTNAVFKALGGTLSFVGTRYLPRPGQYGRERPCTSGGSLEENNKILLFFPPDGITVAICLLEVISTSTCRGKRSTG
ncbi:hypothetical protein BJY52DRAFT_1292006 [Lactarius psammicola]|nr:hypothetical protein BJY52DRAFT_1292006 [Lactarius psammicola]